MSSIRVLILGILNDKKPRHGYEVKQELESWNAGEWANIAYGSIYSALKTMSEEGLLKVVQSEEPSPKTLYEITKSGAEVFMTLLRKQWWEHKPMIDPFQVALCFMNQMPKAELIVALQHRADNMKVNIKSMERLSPIRWQSNPDWPRHVNEIFNLLVMRMKAEVEWLEGAIQKIEEDKLP